MNKVIDSLTFSTTESKETYKKSKEDIVKHFDAIRVYKDNKLID